MFAKSIRLSLFPQPVVENELTILSCEIFKTNSK